MSAGPYRTVEIQEEPARPKTSWWRRWWCKWFWHDYFHSFGWRERQALSIILKYNRHIDLKTQEDLNADKNEMRFCCRCGQELIYIYDRDFPLAKQLNIATLLLTPLDDEKTP